MKKKEIKIEPEWKDYKLTQTVKTPLGEFPVTISFYAKLPDNVYIDSAQHQINFNSYSKKYGMNLLYPSRWEVLKEACRYIFSKH